MKSPVARYLPLLMVFITWPSQAQVPAGDTLRIQGIAPGGSVAVMLKGRTSDGRCRTRIFRSTGDTALPNVVPSDTCKSEIAVFSKTHAMVHKSIDTWTNGAGDVLTVALGRLIRVPVYVWTANEADRERATSDMTKAVAIYMKNSVGIRLSPRHRNVPPEGVALIGTVRCGAVAEIKESAFYVRRALNVYYVDGAFTGRNCAISQTPPDCPSASNYPALEANITYIGTDATGTTLAHELGHAFGLRPSPCGGHTNDLAGFAESNVMWAAGGDERIRFSLGQAFRMNTHRDQWGGTMLIRNGLRPGPGRHCPPDRTSFYCPALRTGWPP